VGCNDDETATQLTPEFQAAVESGKTYFIVVSSKSPEPPAGRFTLTSTIESRADGSKDLWKRSIDERRLRIFRRSN